MSAKLAFLQSRRFWGLIVIAVVGVLGSEGIFSEEIVSAIIIVIGGFIGIRTVDKFGEARK